MDDLVSTLLEVRLASDDAFLKVKETLTRIGVASPKNKKLYQSCHILHKRGRYYIVHFKELFALDGKQTNFDKEDRARRNTIATLLNQWGLVELVSEIGDETAPINQIKIISYSDKPNWDLVPKYNIGKK